MVESPAKTSYPQPSICLDESDTEDTVEQYPLLSHGQKEDIVSSQTVSEEARSIACVNRSPNLNAFAERFVLSAKVELLNRLVITTEAGLRHALREFLAHYHGERPHQGIGNVVPFPANDPAEKDGEIIRSDRLAGLLKSYSRKAA